MLRSNGRSVLLAASLFALAGTPAPGGQLCKPHLSVKDVRFSEPQNLQRTWTAVLDVDASACSAAFGRFDIHFVRDKENAPELEFTEQFAWQTGARQTGQIEVSIDLWIDEAVQDYSVAYIAPCGCRH